eukprot:PhF_6_TR35005/c0_g1_i2/m.50912/K09866/AQP4; aquaporin-4
MHIQLFETIAGYKLLVINLIEFYLSAASTYVALSATAHAHSYKDLDPLYSIIASSFAVMTALVMGSFYNGGTCNPAISLSFIVSGVYVPHRLMLIPMQILGALAGAGLISASGYSTSSFTNVQTIPENSNASSGYLFLVLFIECIFYYLFTLSMFLWWKQHQSLWHLYNAFAHIAVSCTLRPILPSAGLGALNPAVALATAMLSGNWSDHYLCWAASLSAALVVGIGYCVMQPRWPHISEDDVLKESDDVEELDRAYPKMLFCHGVCECFASAIFLFHGCGSIVLYNKTNSVLTVALSFGTTVAALISGFGHVSGVQFNPSVTLGLFLARRLSWRRSIVFVVAQHVGGLMGVGILWCIQNNGSLVNPGTKPHEHLMGANQLSPSMSDIQGLIQEIVLSFIHLALVLHLGSRITSVSSTHAALYLGLYVVAICPAGVGMNPMRSLVPAVISWFWEGQWVYQVGPYVGASIAAGFVVLMEWLSGMKL